MKTKQTKKVFVIGHKNPDTDSICAAIAYADLKNQTTETVHIPKRAGHVNEETKFVLERFKVEAPGYIKDVGAQVKDIEIRKTAGVSERISMKKAWELMKSENVVTLPITTDTKELEGLILISDIATSYMDIYDSHILATARTPYKNILETLNATLLVGNEHGYIIKGKVLVAAANPDLMEDYIEDDDLVILGNRYESQLCALEMNAGCIIVCEGAKVSLTIQKIAQERDCVVISSPYDTFTVARLINQSMPIKFFMRKEEISKFELEDYVEDIKEVMAKERNRDFPILDAKEKYVGMISRRNLLDMQKKQIILVDHNERTQAVDGIEGAEILEIIDHHRLGSLETISPVFFRNQPLGCTSTIVYQMYGEKNIEIPKKIAGLLCAAIVSDTLMYRSPTCTELDRMAAESLAKITGTNVEELAKEMFQAGSDFKTKSAEEIFYQDFKTFCVNNADFGVGQISAMSDEELVEVKEKLLPFMEKVQEERKLQMVFVMLTNIAEEQTELLCYGNNAKQLALEAFRVRNTGDTVILKGVVSRKKQLIPAFMDTLHQ